MARPKIGDQLKIRLDPDLLLGLADYCDTHKLSRGDGIRALLEIGLRHQSVPDTELLVPETPVPVVKRSPKPQASRVTVPNTKQSVPKTQRKYCSCAEPVVYPGSRYCGTCTRPLP